MKIFRDVTFTFARVLMIGISSSLEQFGTTLTNTLPSLLSNPKTGVLPAASRPLFPLILSAQSSFRQAQILQILSLALLSWIPVFLDEIRYNIGSSLSQKSGGSFEKLKPQDKRKALCMLFKAK